MINAWSLLHEEYYGTMAKTYPIKENDMSPCKLENIKITSLESDEYDPIVTVGSGNTASAFFVDSTDWENISIDTSNCPVTLTGLSTVQIYTPPPIEEPLCTAHLDDIIFTDADTWPHADTLNINIPDDYPSAFTAFSDNDDAIAHHITTPTPGISRASPSGSAT